MIRQTAWTLLLVVAARADHEASSPCPDELPSNTGDRLTDLYQCDRECRWNFGFNDRTIIGTRANRYTVRHDQSACCCYKNTAEGGIKLNNGALIDRISAKQFDTVDTWSGTDSTGFDSVWACVKNSDGSLESKNKEQAKSDGSNIIHCGKCAMCSDVDDVTVLSTTRAWITRIMTLTSSKFAAPWGHHNVTLLQEDLFDLSVNFSLGSIIDNYGTDEEPSCMKCWSDNIMCDARQCTNACWEKFFDPAPTEPCLECDETTCGPEFIKCAGANRRSTGLVSDIPRTDRMQCQDGFYYGVSSDDLPTVAQPSDDDVDEICARNAGESSLKVV